MDLQGEFPREEQRVARTNMTWEQQGYSTSQKPSGYQICRVPTVNLTEGTSYEGGHGQSKHSFGYSYRFRIDDGIRVRVNAPSLHKSNFFPAFHGTVALDTNRRLEHPSA